MKNYKNEELTEIQKVVALKNGTESPFKNEYYDNFREGIYVDILSGKILFTSDSKFQCSCGWPSFSKPYNEDEILEVKDYSHKMIRTEVRSKTGNTHLGHVFNDGPNGGLRYCINSASMKFIPKEDMEKEGYSL